MRNDEVGDTALGEVEDTLRINFEQRVNRGTYNGGKY